LTLKEFPNVPETLEQVERIPEYWKEKVEYLVELPLDYQPSIGTETEYWRRMYEDLAPKAHKKLKKHLLDSGDYQYLLILMRLDPMYYEGKDFDKAFTNATHNSDVEAFKLLFGLYTSNGELNWDHYLSYCIVIQNDEIFYTMIDLIEPYATKYEIKQIIGEISQSAKIDYFQEVISKYSYLITPEEAAYSAYVIDYEICGGENDLLPAKKLAEFLKYILAIPTQRTYKVSDYWNTYLSKEEALVLVQSDKVIIDELMYYNIKPEVALVFYGSPKVNDDIKDDAFMRILVRDDVLKELLDKKDLNIPIRRIISYIGEDKLYKRIIQHRKYPKRDLEELLGNALREDYRESIKYVYKLLGSDPRTLERVIMTQPITKIKDDVLSLLMKLGVSLDVVGERIAFLMNLKTLKKLKLLGYSLDSISHDLVLESLLRSGISHKAAHIGNFIGVD
jgi:hypothetical protein